MMKKIEKLSEINDIYRQFYKTPSRFRVFFPKKNAKIRILANSKHKSVSVSIRFQQNPAIPQVFHSNE